MQTRFNRVLHEPKLTSAVGRLLLFLLILNSSLNSRCHLIDITSELYVLNLLIITRTYRPTCSLQMFHLNPSQIGRYSIYGIYSGGMEGRVDLGGWVHIPRWFTCQETVAHPSSNPARCRATSQRANHCTIRYRKLNFKHYLVEKA